MSFCYSYCGAIWSMLVGPLSGLLYTLLSIGYNDPKWSLGLYSCYFGLSWPITFVGSFGPFLSPWASLAHLLSLGVFNPFSNSAFPWAFNNSFGLPYPNYHILHPWGLWAFHQPLTFLIHYFGRVVAHSCSSTSHNTHEFTTSFSGLLWAHLLSSRLICLLYKPMTHYSCHSGLMGFLSILLTLSCPYCSASSCYWAFLKQASTMSKILPLNLNIHFFVMYFEFSMIIMLRKLELWYKVFCLLSREYWFSTFNPLKLIIYLMKNSVTHAFCYPSFFFFFLVPKMGVH